MLGEVLGQCLREGDPEAPLLLYHGEWRTRGWMWAVAKSLTRVLNDIGVPASAPVGFAPHSRPIWAAALMGLAAREQPMVMLYAYLSPTATAAKIRELALPVMIGDTALWTDECLTAADEVGCVAIALSDEAPHARLLGATSARSNWPVAKPGIAFLTSGTTGEPRHHHIDYEVIHERIVKSALQQGNPVAPPALAFYPPSNISGIYTLLPPLAAGQRLLMLDKFDVKAWADYVETYRPGASGLPVAALAMILEVEVPKSRIASLQYVTTGASALPEPLRQAFERAYGIPVLQAYGATEFCGVIARTLPSDREEFGEAIAQSSGRAMQGHEIRITNPQSGDRLAAGEEGRMEVRTPWSNGEWVRTTDLAALDAKGFLFVRGRLDGVISRGGFKIKPESVVEALLQHPSVTRCAVVGLPDARLGEVPAALIECLPDEEPTVEDLQAYLREHLPAPAIPTRFKFVSELPRTISLKQDLAAAKRLLAD